MTTALRSPAGRRLALLAAFLLLAPMYLLGRASSAEAATCNPYYYGQPGVEVGVTFQWAPECSDGVAQIWDGTVTDRSCDGRAGYVWFEVWDQQANGSFVRIDVSPKYGALNGCNTSSTFPTWRPRSPGTVGWKLVVKLQACNGLSCSSLRSYPYTG